LNGASRRNGGLNYKSEIKNGVENSTPFFYIANLAERGFFYSVNVVLQGRPLAGVPCKCLLGPLVSALSLCCFAAGDA
jgi:hypothetical protein